MDALVIFGIFCWSARARWKHITPSESDETSTRVKWDFYMLMRRNAQQKKKKIVNGTVLARWDPDIGPLSSYHGVLLRQLHIQ